MSGNRRRFFQDAAFFGAGFFSLAEALRGNTQASDPKTARAIEQGRHHSPYGNHKKKEAARSHRPRSLSAHDHSGPSRPAA